MIVHGTAQPVSDGSAKAPYVQAVVFGNYPGANPEKPIVVSFLIDTGADRTMLSLRKALQLIGYDQWQAVCRRPCTIGGIGGSKGFWEVSMEIWFVDNDPNRDKDFFVIDTSILVPFYSEQQDYSEQASERAGREPVSLLGRDVIDGMRFEFDVARNPPVTLTAPKNLQRPELIRLLSG